MVMEIVIATAMTTAMPSAAMARSKATAMPSAAMATSKESNGYVNGPRAVRPVAALEPDHHPVYWATDLLEKEGREEG